MADQPIKAAKLGRTFEYYKLTFFTRCTYITRNISDRRILRSLTGTLLVTRIYQIIMTNYCPNFGGSFSLQDHSETHYPYNKNFDLWDFFFFPREDCKSSCGLGLGKKGGLHKKGGFGFRFRQPCKLNLSTNINNGYASYNSSLLLKQQHNLCYPDRQIHYPDCLYWDPDSFVSWRNFPGRSCFVCIISFCSVGCILWVCMLWLVWNGFN